ncbi:MAG: homocitrate synthase [Candidatus Altiarchaeota archaeon]|nr:homocitrate synthase [Candidatus Altiarchaeota archaeon]
MTKPTIYFIDVTNRDGVQTARLGLAKLQKTILNIMLDRLGIFQSEFGFPNTRHELNYLNANLELHDIGALKNMRLSGWIRAKKEDVETAFKNVPGLKHVNVSMSTSDQMIKGKFGGKMDRAGIIKNMVDAVRAAKNSGAETVGVNAEDASRTTDEQLAEFALAAKDAGACRIRYCDTLGYDDPMTIYSRIKRLAESIQMPIELHCHNDLGMAVACSVAGAKGAIDAGFDAYINTSVNGMGERAGNADLVSSVLAAKKSSGMVGNYQIDSRIDLTHAWKMARYASYAFQVPIPINQPAVGANAFAHESGIHADGALKDSRNYELYHYEELGRGEPEIIETGRQIVAGEYSGIKGFRNVAGKLEIEFKDEEDAKKVLELARYANVHTQLPLVDDEIRFIAKYPEQAKKILTVTP